MIKQPGNLNVTSCHIISDLQWIILGRRETIQMTNFRPACRASVFWPSLTCETNDILSILKEAWIDWNLQHTHTHTHVRIHIYIYEYVNTFTQAYKIEMTDINTYVNMIGPNATITIILGEAPQTITHSQYPQKKLDASRAASWCDSCCELERMGALKNVGKCEIGQSWTLLNLIEFGLPTSSWLCQ